MFALVFSVLSAITIGEHLVLFNVDIDSYIKYSQPVSVSVLLKVITHYIYYFLLVDIAFVTLTIVKRSYVLLTNEIVLLKDTPTTITDAQFEQYFEIAIREIVKDYPADVQNTKTDELKNMKQDIYSEIEDATKDEAFSSYLFVGMIKQQLLLRK